MRTGIKIYLNNKKTKEEKSRMKKLLLIPVILLLAATHVFAQNFPMGEETKGFKVKVSDETDISFRVRLQPRIDIGDLIKNEDGNSNESEMDMYLRRIRLEIGGQLYTNLKYSLVFEADKNGKFASTSGSPTNEVKIQIANIDYKSADAFNVRFGKAKLPYSRISLTSSSKQLIIERPVSTEAAKKLFDDYYQSHLMLHGKIAEGIFAYNLAVGDGWEPNSTINSSTVHKSDPLYVARLELSPPGWIEKDKSDSHLGKDKHLALGVNYAQQKGIEYKTTTYGEDRTLMGVDISGHYEGFTAQFEYNTWKEKYTNPATKEKKPKGWYGQAGYFISGLNAEPVARYEIYDQDSNSSDKKEKTTTIGANWYAKGHSFKIGLNWASTKYEKSASGWLANDDTKDVYQVQAQLYF